MPDNERERIGFIGAGLMGRGMALHLLRAGHPLSVYVHRNREGIDELLAEGARETHDLRELAASCDARCVP